MITIPSGFRGAGEDPFSGVMVVFRAKQADRKMCLGHAGGVYSLSMANHHRAYKKVAQLAAAKASSRYLCKRRILKPRNWHVRQSEAPSALGDVALGSWQASVPAKFRMEGTER